MNNLVYCSIFELICVCLLFLFWKKNCNKNRNKYKRICYQRSVLVEGREIWSDISEIFKNKKQFSKTLKELKLQSEINNNIRNIRVFN